VRLTRAVVEEVIGAAERQLLVISFAAYRVPVIVDALVAATGRGVQLDLVLETAADSAGKLTFDSLNAFAELDHTRIWHWPSARRPRLESGSAVLHAKAIVADAKLAFVTSANLTGHAIAYNIELGLLVRSAAAAGRIDGYVRGLIGHGDLIRIDQLSS
jgi:phosphatidylserine/phosphatidylglycerophosphate/cardiolipin synthase-like enzyme